MIQLSDVVARSRSGPKVELAPLSLSFAPGASYALVGAANDGVELLLAVLAGRATPRKGTSIVLGSPAAPRAGIAYVPYVPELPEVLHVDGYLKLAASVRGERALGPEERLHVLGVAPLARRRIGDLTLPESRAVALVEALTSQAPVVLLVDPLADLDPRAVSRVAPAIDARVAAGATVVCSTASTVDAHALGRTLLFFQRGKLTSQSSDEDAWEPPVGPHGARLFIRSEGARFLLAELAGDPTFQHVSGEGVELVVTGRDPIAMASGIAMATRRANVELDLLTFERAEDDA